VSPRTGLLFLGAPAVPEMVSLARRAEAAGFESAWVAETRLTRLREYCEVIPRLLAGEAVTFRGQCVELDGARIEDVLARDDAANPRNRIPLYLAATGPRAVEYAGEVADAVLLNVCLPVEYVRERRERLVRSLRASFTEGGVDAAARCVGDNVVDLLSASGSVEDCRRRLEEYRDAGVDLPILAPVEGALELTIDALA
jgi:alkanesulfonate monooxygenase SsuD/methylene tetrahydromethanopterin reductase-like flavin-dependent oxidoreductase (luciferase family)